MQKLTRLILFISVIYSINASGQYSCEDPYVLQSNNTVTIDMPFNQADPPGNYYYDCLSTQVNPAWFKVSIRESGDLTLNINGNEHDMDFICWGPFDEASNCCSSDALSADNVVDCSYSPSDLEVCNITSAIADKYYMILVTNFSNYPGQVTISFEGEALLGPFNTFVYSNSPICEGENLVLHSTYYEGAEYNWSGPNGFTSTNPSESLTTTSIADEGTYELQIINEGIITDFQIEVEIIESLDLYAGDDQIIPMNTITQLEGTLNNNPSNYEILWSPQEYVVIPNQLITNTVALNEPVNFTLSIYNPSTGCTSKDEILVTPSTDIGKVDNESKITIYPNPAHEYIKIITPKNYLDNTLNVYTSSGKMVSSRIITESVEIIHLGANISSGKYIIVIENADKIIFYENFIVRK
jgi:hypothetical protein